MYCVWAIKEIWENKTQYAEAVANVWHRPNSTKYTERMICWCGLSTASRHTRSLEQFAVGIRESGKETQPLINLIVCACEELRRWTTERTFATNWRIWMDDGEPGMLALSQAACAVCWFDALAYQHKWANWTWRKEREREKRRKQWEPLGWMFLANSAEWQTIHLHILLASFCVCERVCFFLSCLLFCGWWCVEYWMSTWRCWFFCTCRTSIVMNCSFCLFTCPFAWAVRKR